MRVYELNPLKDSRWTELVEAHSMATAFHSTSWLEALRRTYDYEPVALTTSPPGNALQNGLVFCRMKSWLTGSRMVSLPFSDHCQPLEDSSGEWNELLDYVRDRQRANSWKYVELRPIRELSPDTSGTTGLKECATFCFHALDLQPNLDEVFSKFHKNCVCRPLKRALREGITTQSGRSDLLLNAFYELLLLTRRRHGLPPQPIDWFRNLIDCFGERLTIRVAFQNTEPIASILTLSHPRSVIYKYGCSDARFHNLGGMPVLFWEAIQAAKQDGAMLFDFGRSDLDNPGLIAFKDHWGTARTDLKYYRYTHRSKTEASQNWKIAAMRKVVSYLPDSCLTIAGKMLYKHIG